MNSQPTSLVEQSFKIMVWDYLLSVPMVLYYLLFFLVLSTNFPDLEKVTWEMLKPQMPLLGGLWVLSMFLQLVCSHMVYQLVGLKKTTLDIGDSIRVAFSKSWLLLGLNILILGFCLSVVVALSVVLKGAWVLAVLGLLLMLFRIGFDLLPALLLSSEFNALSLIRFWMFAWRYHARRFFQVILFMLVISFVILLGSSQLGAIPNFGNSILVPVWLGLSATWVQALWVLFFQDIRVNVKV
jgi:hypothetical protein